MQARHEPGFQGFYQKLKSHIRRRQLGIPWHGDEEQISPAELAKVGIAQDRLHLVQTFTVNYDTYDMRRAKDVINPRNQPFIMLLSHDICADSSPNSAEPLQPYWFAQVVQVMYAKVWDRDKPDVEPELMDILFVRWLGVDKTFTGGWESRRLHRIGFVDSESADAGTEPFGFVDPKAVMRGCHLIPAFAHGKTTGLMGPSTMRPGTDADEDWALFYVNM